MHDRHDLTDEQWARLEPLLPDRTPIRGGRWVDHRRVIDGVLWRTRTGSPWRDLPVGYGNWKTVYHRHRRWSGDGTWSAVLDGLRVGCDGDVGAAAEWVLSTDGTVIRAHHHSAGARHEPPKDIAAEVLAPTVLEVSLRPSQHTGGCTELHGIRDRRGHSGHPGHAGQ